MNTHKVIDVLTKDHNIHKVGSFDECLKWKHNQGYGYHIEYLSTDEYVVANEDDHILMLYALLKMGKDFGILPTPKKRVDMVTWKI